MPTELRGRQIKLEDFIENLATTASWNSTTKTATQAAIKALVDGSGSIQYVGGGRTPTYINELAVGIYFVVENGMLYYNRNDYFSITQEGFLIVDGTNPYNDMGKGYHVICGNGMVHHGLAARSRTYSSHNIGYLNVMIGAADGWAGKSGNVPQPRAGDNHKFLKGDGTWGEPNVFDGATSSASGQKGAVPAPQAGDNEKFLKGDGTWGDRIEHITGEVNIWELNDGIYLFDEGFSINATRTQHFSPGEKGYISILQDSIYEYEKGYYAVTARGFLTYGITSEYSGSINKAMIQTLGGSILEYGRGCLVPGKKDNETYYTLTGEGWSPGIISLAPEKYANTWDKIQLKRVLLNGPAPLFNCSEQYIKDFLLKGGKVIVWSRTESDETFRMYEADNENGNIQEGNVVLRNISYQNGKLVVSEFRAQTSGQTEYWQLTQHEL